MLVVLLALSLSCALVFADEDVREDKLQVRETRGAVKADSRQRKDEAGVEMSDEPTEVVEEEQTKPKKKKTPEEVEAGESNKCRCTFMRE